MCNVNFVKNIDSLGRIVIPMDIRRKLNINSGDFLSITCSDNNINLSKFNCLDNNMKVISILDSFFDIYNIRFILLGLDYVIYSNVINKYIKLDGYLIDKIRMGNNIKCINESIIFGDKRVEDYYNMVPIITNDGIVGSLILLGNDIKIYDLCSIIVKIIVLELNIS